LLPVLFNDVFAVVNHKKDVLFRVADFVQDQDEDVQAVLLVIRAVMRSAKDERVFGNDLGV
jgi:hypothetical protein